MKLPELPGKMGQAITTIGNLVELVSHAVQAFRRGEYDRVEEIIPETLRTSVEKALADERAHQKFAVADDYVRAGATGEGHA